MHISSYIKLNHFSMLVTDKGGYCERQDLYV